MEELRISKEIYEFKIWAYVVMPHHVHLLIWPLNSHYDIGKIESEIKGVMAKKYRKELYENDRKGHGTFLITENKQTRFVFWQKGGGFDRNLWNAKAIHDSIRYIEANPTRSHLVSTSNEWPWSSAYARWHQEGLIPDTFATPVEIPNPQAQRIGVL